MTHTRILLSAVAVLALAPSVSHAGKGGSAAAIRAAVESTSVDAIIAELERAEGLICSECVPVVAALTTDARYPVREVAAWWFGRRQAYLEPMVAQFTTDLATRDTIAVRNAADFLGATRTLGALPQLRAAIRRTDLGAEARLAIVRAAATLNQTAGNDVLVAGMADRDAGVRAAAVAAWRDMLGQTHALPVVPLLADADASVRAQACGVIGGLLEQTGRTALEGLVVNDGDPVVRRNAAWALGQLGNVASRGALTLAAGDPSGIVRGIARAALAQLK